MSEPSENPILATDVEMTPELAAKVGDLFDYAHLHVGIGVNPDNPDDAYMQAMTVPKSRPVCFNLAAKALRDLADSLEKLHEIDGCNR
ncbi:MULTISPECIES: hypothetical protein [unclassified Rhodococcus (in: high G+C Gram-positive bacteria)]|uniref:hypothetical protein n=1 Tax=unclassified Rhodococcus (in: high G+C Gram-positive bacteria) TaxID=192944 RepID=UPI00117A604E|nr:MULTISPECIES: hypothetical protein [unclassified Rhodococcus (in: high G+C Gram-positive bacteria)]